MVLKTLEEVSGPKLPEADDPGADRVSIGHVPKVKCCNDDCVVPREVEGTAGCVPEVDGVGEECGVHAVIVGDKEN